jgi:hypothetical protein
MWHFGTIAQSVQRRTTGWRTGVPFPADIILSSTASRPAPEPTELPIEWLPSALPKGLKRPKRAADHSPRHGAEVKNGGTTYLLLHTSSGNGTLLVKHGNVSRF